jgi:hypothetical protein
MDLLCIATAAPGLAACAWATASPGLAALAWLASSKPQKKALITCVVAEVTCTCEPGSHWGSIVGSFACGLALGGCCVAYLAARIPVSRRLPSQPRGKLSIDR